MRRRYGAGPLHLLGHVALTALTGWALSHALQPTVVARPVDLLVWLLGGAIVHDLLLLPAYALLGAAAGRALARDRGRRVSVVNHVRVPAVLSGVVLLVHAPRIFDRQPQNVRHALGAAPPDYLGRWLALTGALAAASALLYGVRAARAARAARRAT